MIKLKKKNENSKTGFCEKFMLILSIVVRGISPVKLNFLSKFVTIFLSKPGAQNVLSH